MANHNDLNHILQELRAFSPQQQNYALQELTELTGTKILGVGIKKIILAIETAKQDEDMAGRFASIMSRAVIEGGNANLGGGGGGAVSSSRGNQMDYETSPTRVQPLQLRGNTNNNNDARYFDDDLNRALQLPNLGGGGGY